MAFWWARKKTKMVFMDVGGVIVNCDLDRYLPICCAKFHTTPEPLMREISIRVPDLERGAIDSATFWREIGESLWRRGEGRISDDAGLCHLWRDLMVSSLSVDEDVIRLCQLMHRNGLRLGVLSNVIPEHADYLRSRGIYAPFLPCIISCEIGMRKPNADIYHLAASQANVKPSECLLIDDLESNVKGAKSVGMDAYLFTDASSLAQELLRRGLIKI
ncbi:HAD family phosphatase [bacterium]|nr:HAD family phosphatase [bacterium]